MKWTWIRKWTGPLKGLAKDPAFYANRQARARSGRKFTVGVKEARSGKVFCVGATVGSRLAGFADEIGP